MRLPQYKGTAKHATGGWGSRAPTDPEGMLFSSDAVKAGQRIAYDTKNNEIVVFRRESIGQGSHPDTYHGYVVEWNNLTNEQKSVLIKEGLMTPTGRPAK